MLQQFSWGHFLIAMILLNLVWCVFVVLVFYRTEVLAFLGSSASIGNGGSSTKAELGSKAPNKDHDEKIEHEADAALMGPSRLPDGVEVRSSAQVGFSAPASDGRYDQVGLVADVMQELKAIFLEMEKKAAGKRDFFRLLQKVKEEYGPLGGHPSIGALRAFVAEHAPFQLTADELDNLWY